jgi:glycosyltransferase involved in cell wall biosynthesis
MSALRVLQVLTDDDRRGAQVFGYELGERMRELGLEVRSVALATGQTGGLPVDALGPRRLHLRTLGALRSGMAAADVTVAHGSTTLVACGLAGLGPGRPFVYRQISDPVFWTPTLTKRWRTRAMYRLACHVVTLSPSTKLVLRERFAVSDASVTVIPNAVDERRCQPASLDDRAGARRRLDLPPVPGHVLAYVGALDAAKSVADLIRAAPPEATLVIAGDGPERPALEAQAHDRGVDCRFLGAVDDPWDVYAAADLFVLASRTEVQPAVLLEAAMIGTPIIATDVGAITDIVDGGQAGSLVPAGDVPAMRSAIEVLLADGRRRTDLALAARERTESSFSMSVVAQQWVDLLLGLTR